MSTQKVDALELKDLAGPVLESASDVSGRVLATCTASPSGSIIQVYERGPTPEACTHIAAWATDGMSVTHMAWAHPEYGRVLAGATASGSVLVWGQVPELQPGGQGGEEGGGASGGIAEYQPLAEMACGSLPCVAVCFAPRQTGLLLAVLLEEGQLVLYEAAEVLAPRSWNLHSLIRTGPRGVCRGLCWRPFSPGVPPMLCVGCGPQALVWQYVLALNSWQLVARAETGNGQPVESVHWAPPLGRPAELLAVGAGRELLIYSLSGDTAVLLVERLASLEHEHDVWKVEWDLWGNNVAASTNGQEVHVYKPDLVGSWVRLVLLKGQSVETDP